MLKLIVVCAALLIPSAAFAAGQLSGDPSDGCEKNICEDIGRNRFKCEQAPQCFWDTTDQRCEWIQDPWQCGTYLTPISCVSDPECFWDAGDVRCERRD
jgi:hypothetical protein